MIGKPQATQGGKKVTAQAKRNHISDRKNANAGTASHKVHSGAKFNSSTACTSAQQLNQASASMMANNHVATHQNILMMNSRKKNNLCQKVWACVNIVANACESYASRFLRVSFFALNVEMLWFCILNLDWVFKSIKKLIQSEAYALTVMKKLTWRWQCKHQLYNYNIAQGIKFEWIMRKLTKYKIEIEKERTIISFI